jgi:multidrug transporter EmrE-like cation transporter
MPVISPPLLVVVGILTTAVAQVMLKKASDYAVQSTPWILWIGLSGAMYVLSFALYSIILKHFALSKIYPAMTVAQIAVITVIGVAMGESIGGRHLLGLAFGAIAIYLIFG